MKNVKLVNLLSIDLLRCYGILISFFLTIPITAQNWSSIGNFNHDILNLSNDTIANELLLAGAFSMYNNDTVAGVGRWNGTNLTTFGCGVDWDCSSPVITAGFYPQVQSVARYNNDIYVTGSFTYAGNKLVNGLAKWDGNSWNKVGTGLKTTDGSIGLGLKLRVLNNELFVCGVFDSVAGVAVNSIAKYNGTNWISVYDFPLFSGISGNLNWVNDVQLFKNEMYVCGHFRNTPIGTISGIVKWDSNNWVSVGNGIWGSILDVRNMEVFKNELIVSGRFSKSVNPNNPGENIGKWDGIHWSELGLGTDDIIWDIKVHSDTLYVCGAFYHAGGINADKIARWDGSHWCGFGTSITGILKSLDFYNDTLYVAGGFTSINGYNIKNIAKWTGGGYIEECDTTSGIERFQNDDNRLKIYPNPFVKTTTIQLPNEIKNGSVSIYDVLGKKIKQINNLNCKEIIISREGMSNGMYFLSVTDENNIVGQGKILVE